MHNKKKYHDNIRMLILKNIKFCNVRNITCNCFCDGLLKKLIGQICCCGDILTDLFSKIGVTAASTMVI